MGHAVLVRTPGGSEEERLDRLRRRLYAPGATADDLTAYREAEAQEAQAHRPSAVHPPPRPRVPRPPAAAGLLLAVGLAVFVGTRLPVGTTGAGATSTPTSTPTPTSAPTTAPDRYRLPASAAARDEFARALRAGDTPGLLEYVYRHPAYIPPALRTLWRAASTEYSGQGPHTITLAPSDLAQHGGRFTVILVLDRAATYSWRAERPGSRNAMLADAGEVRLGEPTSTTVRYADDAPRRLALYLDETVKWGVVVVFTD